MKQKLEEKAPFLPANRAFVIQFSTETDVPHGRLTGRVEHVVSGQSRHFQSLEELLAFVSHTLPIRSENNLP